MIEALIVNIHIQSLILGLILASVYFKLTRREIKLNEPPLVYYRFPIIGHTWSFLTDCEKLILESRKKYGETFSLYVFGRVVAVVGKDSTQEENLSRLSMIFYSRLVPSNEQIYTRTAIWNILDLCSKFTLDLLIFQGTSSDGQCARWVLVFQNKDPAFLMEIKGILFIIEPKVIHDPLKIMQKIVSFPFSNVAFGEECCHYEDILEIFRSLTSSITRITLVPPILCFIHPWLHQQFITQDSFQRLNDKKRLGDAWIAPLDLLQTYLDDPEVTPDLDPNNVDYNYIADSLGVFIFASMFTTSNRTTSALYGRKEYWQELYQEAQEINKQRNGDELTPNDINKMVKLDSFIKESFRNSDDVLGLPHLCISKSNYTFKNGYQIPEGRIAFLNFLDTHYDKEIQGQDPMEFYAYRHLERNASATKIERNLIIFGNGKHSCPGRFLAVNEIKIILHKIILKYNVRTETGKITPKRYFGPILKRTYDGIVFENRKDIVD
ncbi:25029_t:CDS:10 [Cetraspora pellucida]|uniref:25029_t:CDS:1 n=1 Tax=Cetraspora pellucida TaxID=1433469 RepID=A0A9N9CIG1_9GLOM|nr:25029_t:CDS:10 [Cetraspora pellucida]